MIIEKVKQSLFQPTNYNKNVFHNITREERNALKEIKTLENCCGRVQDKGSRFAVLLNKDYCLKANTQIERGSFITLPSDVTKSFEKKIDGFVLKWENNNNNNDINNNNMITDSSIFVSFDIVSVFHVLTISQIWKQYQKF